MTSSHRFIIYGAGAIGTVFGGMLARAGHDVSLVGRDPHMDSVRENGLIIDGLLGNHLVDTLDTFTDPGSIEQEPAFSAAFISVKSSDTGHAVQALAQNGLVGEKTLVVSLQNGLGNLELIRETFGPARSFGGRVIFGAQLTEPGRVHVSVWADNVLIGGPAADPPDSGQEQTEVLSGHDLARLLTQCGIETEVDDNIEAALWGKVFYNAGLNPLSALLNVTYGELGRQENARKLLVALMKEAFSIASKEVTLPWSSEEEYLELFFSQLLPSTESHHSSMLQDMEMGRETEIEAITGQIIARAELLNVPVPVSRVVYELVKAKVATAKRSQPVNGEQ